MKPELMKTITTTDFKKSTTGKMKKKSRMKGEKTIRLPFLLLPFVSRPPVQKSSPPPSSSSQLPSHTSHFLIFCFFLFFYYYHYYYCFCFPVCNNIRDKRKKIFTVLLK